MDMNRYFFKNSIVAAVCCVLVYYSIAWAVLRCSHEEDASDYQTEIHDRGVNHMDFECLRPDYHTETMAGPTPSELNRFIAEATPHLNDVLVLRNVSPNRDSNLWLRAAFETASLFNFSVPLPRYLALSVLRI
jgi:hypothetical protein